MVGGRKTTVDAELKDVSSGFEEAKADVMGAYNVLFMMDKGVLPAADKPQIRAAYVVGLFRAMRFGDTDAHGRGAAMQYHYLRDKGGIVWDARPSASASTRPSSMPASATWSATSSGCRAMAIITAPRRSSPNMR